MRKLIWKKWVNFLSPTKDQSDDDDYDDESKGSSGQVLVGPMGLIPMNEHNDVSKVFNFWMGHANFDIGKKERQAIVSVPGVETLELMTRYRFRLSVGQVFDEQEVKDQVEEALCKNNHSDEKEIVEPQPHAVGLDKICNYLSKKFPYWAVFVLPDGQLDYKSGPTKEDVSEAINHYPNKAEIVTSWEKEEK